MKNQITKFFASAIILFSVSSCDNGPCISGDNNLVTNTRNIGAYSEIKLMDSYDVECYNDTTYDIEVLGESNLLPYVSTEIYSDELQIKDFPNTCLRENSPISLKTYSPEMNAVTISGSGNIGLDAFTGNNLDLKISGSGSIAGTFYYNKIKGIISGSGDIEFDGDTDYGTYEINGSGSIYADNCKHKYVTIDISGSGDVYVYCTHNLNVKISGSGSVYYTGNPQITSNISGSGSIINNN